MRSVLLRGVLLMTGLVAVLVGVLDLAEQGPADVGHVLVWGAAGVLAHDVLLSGVVLLLGLLAARWLPRWSRAAVVVGVVLLGTVTLAVLPTLVVTWTDPTNTTLLDRPYGRSWLGVAAVVLVGVVTGSWVSRRSGSRAPSGADAQERSGDG